MGSGLSEAHAVLLGYSCYCWGGDVCAAAIRAVHGSTYDALHDGVLCHFEIFYKYLVKVC